MLFRSSENTQCIASALRNAILNLGVIPKVVYQDNGKAFKAKYFQHTDFDESGFNGVYASLGINQFLQSRTTQERRLLNDFSKNFRKNLKK